jgi:hypothetical protein
MGGGERSSALRARLSVETLDGRVMPSVVTPVTPSSGGSQSAAPSQQQYEVQLDAGEWVALAQRGTQNVYVAKSPSGAQWVVFDDTVNDTYAAVLLSSPTEFNPATGTQPYTPDASKPSVVWDSETRTFYTAKAGEAVPTNVTGYLLGGINYIFTAQPVPVPPGLEPAPKPAPVAGGGVTITVLPEPGTTVTVTVGGGSMKIEVPPGVQSPPIKIRIEPINPGNQPLPVPNMLEALPPPRKLHWLDR